MVDRTVNETLFQQLLNHFWIAKRDGYPPIHDLAPKGYLITYGRLVELSGVPLNPRNAGGPLYDIAAYCKATQMPPIHSLVVAKETGYPGEGFFRAPGSDYAGLPFEKAFALWQSDVEACILRGPAEFPANAPYLA
jgi:hypothetical protein